MCFLKIATYISFLRQIISNLLPLCEQSVRSAAAQLGFQQSWMQKPSKNAKSKAKPKAKSSVSELLALQASIAPVAALPIQAPVAESLALQPLQDITHLRVDSSSAATVPAESGPEAFPAVVVNANEHLPSLRVDASSAAAMPAESGTEAPPAVVENANERLPDDLQVDTQVQAEQSGMLPSNARDLIQSNRERARQRREARLQLETSPSASANTVLDASQIADAELAADHVVEAAAAFMQNSDALLCLICQQDLNDGQAKQALECMHVFHAECISQYMRVAGLTFQTTCPLKCNQAIGASTLTQAVSESGAAPSSAMAPASAAEEVAGAVPASEEVLQAVGI